MLKWRRRDAKKRFQHVMISCTHRNNHKQKNCRFIRNESVLSYRATEMTDPTADATSHQQDSSPSINNRTKTSSD
uniref:Uncharacterized protein n=1 Tax=Caenorhabditis japonica TaxID=281687 RepID=A0A8R1ELF9_CAEJA